MGIRTKYIRTASKFDDEDATKLHSQWLRVVEYIVAQIKISHTEKRIEELEARIAAVEIALNEKEND